MQATLDFGTQTPSLNVVNAVSAASTTAPSIGKPYFMGNWQVRSFHGFHQSREGGKGKWRFQISGFNKDTANLLLIGGGTETVHIDQFDRITVLGKKYGRSFWNH